MAKNSEAGPGGKADFRRIDPGVTTQAEFPVKAPSEFRVHFSPDAYRKMKEHAATTAEVELCGVLVGRVCRDAEGAFLEIVGAIEGRGANNYGSQVTFTHETWSHINEVKDRDFADQRIVGWYHTHPGFGVFLSSMDTFIQENFFSQPYQVAVVIETRQNVEGCFAWKDGRCEAMRRYWVGGREAPLASGDAEAFGAPGGGAAAGLAAGDAREVPAPGGFLPQLALPSVATILGVALAFAAGALLDRWLVGANMAQVVQQTVESEVYSTFENAALGTMAAQDFRNIRDRLKAVRESPPRDQAARIEETENLLASLGQQYEKKRTMLRQELQDMSARRAGMGERLDLAQRRQLELTAMVVNLYLLRVSDVLSGLDAERLAKMGEGERGAVKAMLEQVIQMFPEAKYVIQKSHPGVIEFFYPASDAGAAKAAETPKK
jgi:proteasome lid subunit RPN8/RPN11